MSIKESTRNTTSSLNMSECLEDTSINLNDNLDCEEVSIIKTDDSLNISELQTPATPEAECAELSITLDHCERELLGEGTNAYKNKKDQTIQQKETIVIDMIENISVNETTDTKFDSITLDDDDADVNGDVSIVELEEVPNLLENITVTEVIVTQSKPFKECAYFQDPFIEVGRRLWNSNARVQHYTKGCLWSPDGTCILVPVHMNGMHVIELPTDLYSVDVVTPAREVSDLQTAVHVKEGGTVYDCAWYPFMNSGAPETCCWLATRQHEPIHMWDAFTGERRCSYRGYDEVDEVEAAISVTFSNDGQQVIAGYKKSIKIFDTNIPGRDCTTFPVKNAISCLALTSEADQTITAGTWNAYIHHYDLRASPKLGPLFTLAGHSGGITWLRYAQDNDTNWMLYSGARKDNKILKWDMRNYTKPVLEFTRTVETNQRVYFDISPQQEWMVSGDTQGMLRIWDLNDNEAAKVVLLLHKDCCNGVNFHPTRPIMATCSGQYHFIDTTQAPAVDGEQTEKIVDYENSLLLLWFGRSENTDW